MSAQAQADVTQRAASQPSSSGTTASKGGSSSSGLKKEAASAGSFDEQEAAMSPSGTAAPTDLGPGGVAGGGAGGAGDPRSGAPVQRKPVGEDKQGEGAARAGAGGPAEEGQAEGGAAGADDKVEGGGEVAVSSPDDKEEKEAEEIAKAVTGESAPDDGPKVEAPPGAEGKAGKADDKVEGADKPDEDKEPEADEETKRSEQAVEKAGNKKAGSQESCPECGSAMVSKKEGGPKECSTCGKKAAPADEGGKKGELAKLFRKANGAGSVQLRTGAIKPQDGGEPLAQGVRSRVEPLVGADLSNVRVHSGEAVQAKAAEIGARAFTSGSHIFLGAGAHQGDTALMAHEATHTVQQQGSGNNAVQRKGVIDSIVDKGKDLAKKVVPDSILNAIKGKKSEAEGAGPGLESKAETAASSAKTEAGGVDGKAKGPAEQGVEAGKSQAQAAGDSATTTATDATAKTEAVKAEAQATGAQMATAGPTADWSTDPVACITDPAPAGGGEMSGGAGGGGGAGGAQAQGAGGGGGGGGAGGAQAQGAGGGGGGGGGAQAQGGGGGGGPVPAAPPAPSAGGGGGGGGGAQTQGGGANVPAPAPAPAEQGGGGGGPAPAPTNEGGGGGGGAPPAAEGGGAAPNPGKEIADGAKGDTGGAWNCDQASVVNYVTKKGKEAVAALTRAAKAVVPEEVWNFATEKIANARQKIAQIKKKVTEVKNKIVNFVDEKTKPLRDAVEKAKTFVADKYESAKTFVQDKVNNAKKWASDKWNSLKTKVSTGVNNAISWGKQKASSVLTAAKNLAGKFWSMIPDWIKSPITNAVGAVGSFVTAAKEKIGAAKTWIGEKATAFGEWAKGKADGAVKTLAKGYKAVKGVVVKAGTAIGEGVGWVKQKGGELADKAWNAVDGATGGRLSKWKAAAQKKMQELKGAACGVANDVAGPCIEKALPAPTGEGGKSFATVALTGDVTVPIYGVPVKVTGGASCQIARTGDKYTATLTGEASAGVGVTLKGGGGESGSPVTLSVDGSLPNKAKAMMKLNGGAGIPSGLPGIPLTGGPGGSGGGAGGAAPAGGAPAAGGTAPAPAPAAGGGAGQGQAAGGGGGAGGKVTAEVARKLKISATYEFDASASKANTCDGLGGMAAFLGAHGAAAVLPQPFSAMAQGAAGGAFANNFKSATATWSDTGKIAAEGEIAGIGKGSVEAGMERGVEVGISKEDRKDKNGKATGGKDTVISAKLFQSVSGQGAAEFVPGGVSLLKGSLGIGGSAELSITYNMDQNSLDAGAKLALTGSVGLSGFPGILQTLPGVVKGPVMAQLQKYNISPDTHEGTISMEVSLNVEKLAALASAIDAELEKGDGATAAGLWSAVKKYIAENVKKKFEAKLTVNDKILGVKVGGGNGEVSANAGLEISQGMEIPLCSVDL